MRYVRVLEADMPLTTQPTKWPTRKIAAVIIAGAVTGGAQAALGIFAPDWPATEFLQQVDIAVQTGVMVLAGYFTKEREA